MKMKTKFRFGFGNLLSPKHYVSPLQMTLTLIMIICLVLSNILVNKSIDLFGLEWLPNTCAVFVFPLTYILSDVFSEVYGYKWSRITATWAFMGTLLCSAFFMISIGVQGNAAFENQAAFETVLGTAPKIALASVVAYWFGDWANDAVFQLIKKVFKGSSKTFAIRAMGSSIVGKYVDQIIFTFIGLSFLPLETKILMILTAPLVNLGVEACLMPLTITVKNLVMKAENKQVENEQISEIEIKTA